MSIGEKVDELNFKQKECIKELVELFRFIEEKKTGIRINSQSYRFLSRLEQLLIDSDEEAYKQYIENKEDRKLAGCINLLFDLTNRDGAVLCYYHHKDRGAEGDMYGNSKILWDVLVRCLSDGLEECRKSIEDLVQELRDE